ncbi:MAG: YIP1 family protein [Candidatus Woesearchaeota archaeon]|jgi:hypothetical protein|nr:YIP1 family protein [Candidatus Woesearchaeota archaeon]
MGIINYIKNTTRLFFGKFEEGYEYLKENTNFLGVFSFGMFLSVLTMLISVLYLISTDPTFDAIYNTIGNLFILIVIVVGLIQFSFIYFGVFGLLHLFLKVFKAEGTYLETIKYVIGASTFTLLASLVLTIIPPTFIQKSVIIGAIFGLTLLAILIWGIYVNISILSKVHNITKLKVVYAVSCVFGVLMLFALSYIWYFASTLIRTV